MRKKISTHFKRCSLCISVRGWIESCVRIFGDAPHWCHGTLNSNWIRMASSSNLCIYFVQFHTKRISTWQACYQCGTRWSWTELTRDEHRRAPAECVSKGQTGRVLKRPPGEWHRKRLWRGGRTMCVPGASSKCAGMEISGSAAEGREKRGR